MKINKKASSIILALFSIIAVGGIIFLFSLEVKDNINPNNWKLLGEVKEYKDYEQKTFGSNYPSCILLIDNSTIHIRDYICNTIQQGDVLYEHRYRKGNYKRG